MDSWRRSTAGEGNGWCDRMADVLKENAEVSVARE